MSPSSAPFRVVRKHLYSIGHKTIQLLRDLTALILFVAGLWTFAACVFYYPDDPGLLLATNKEPENIGGFYGSTYADLLLQTLGYAAYLPSVLLMIWSVQLFNRGAQANLLPRIMFAPLALSFFAAMWDAWFSDTIGPAETGAGGHIGKGLAKGVAFAFSKIGADHVAWSGCLLAACAAATLIYTIGLAQPDFTPLNRKKTPAQPFEEQEETGLNEFFKKAKSGFSIKSKAAFHEDNEPDDDELQPKTSLRSKLKAAIAPEATKADKKIKNLEDRYGSVKKNGSKNYMLPSTGLLQEAPRKKKECYISQETMAHNGQLLESVLEDFNVRGEIKSWRPGPVVTLYELEPAPGVRSSRVIGLADDIARAMSAISARVAVVPGKNAMGIELPNSKRETVFLREILEEDSFASSNKELPMGLGKDIGGDPVVADLAKMPHLLIAGTTGSGKSVGINTMILSLLYKLSPKQCKMIMIDPKMLELSVYDGIPHLLTPVVVNPKKAVLALKWAVREMEERYDMMSKTGVRKLSAFNTRIEEAKQRGEVLTRKRACGFDPSTGKPVEEEEVIPLEPLPYIVVIVDEMADLMMVAGKEIEGAIQRLAQMARAAGIHLIMATQRPSVDVITGTIKANFPTRISFQVTSKIDSRTILGEQGAEQLLGQGDMLFMESGGKVRRVHGAFVADEEVENIVAALKKQGAPEYIDSVTSDPEEGDAPGFEADEDADPVFAEAVEIVRRDGKASTSYIQRRLKIGYNRAARIMEEMEDKGIVTPTDHTGKREILPA